MLVYTVRPLQDVRGFTGAAETSRFKASWTDTLDLLEHEIAQLNGSNVVVLEVDVDSRGIRNDGMLRADARANSPRVRLAFESANGPLQFACDTYAYPGYGRPGMAEPWQHNVRAIAMTLEALRAVQRYGAASSGEQYRGFAALPPGTGAIASGMTTTEAEALIRDWAIKEAPTDFDTSHGDLATLARYAKRASHPDRNDSDRAGWNRVDTAVQTLQRAGKLP